MYDFIQDPDKVNVQTNPGPACQEISSDQNRKGPDPAYQELSSHSGRANVNKPAGDVNNDQMIIAYKNPSYNHESVV